jgi:hypothetical protein
LGREENAKRFHPRLLVTIISAGLLALGTPSAHASSKGRKNTTLGLCAAALYELLGGNSTTGLIAGAGTAYACKRYRDARNETPALRGRGSTGSGTPLSQQADR